MTAPIVFLMGPTAAGKTDLAVSLVRALDAEIVSVDSAMVYRGMDIGTGKPEAAVLADAPHHLIDIRDPAASYSAAEFRADATALIDTIRARGRLPLLVGGTGLYFRALRDGLSPLPRADAAVRREIEAEAEVHGWAELHRRLASLDPRAGARIHPNDPQRIQRALEVHAVAGRPMSDLLDRCGDRGLTEPVLELVLEPRDRQLLHRRIESRFRTMVASGLLEEVAGLRATPGLHADLPSMRAVGYRQVWRHLDGETERDTMIDRAVAATRQLARRQLTWLRREERALRIDPFSAGARDRALEAVERRLRI